MKELLKDEYDVDVDNKNEDERTPCHLAANYGHVEVLKLILEKDSFAIFDNDEDDKDVETNALATRGETAALQ